MSPATNSVSATAATPTNLTLHEEIVRHGRGSNNAMVITDHVHLSERGVVGTDGNAAPATPDFVIVCGRSVNKARVEQGGGGRWRCRLRVGRGLTRAVVWRGRYA